MGLKEIEVTNTEKMKRVIKDVEDILIKENFSIGEALDILDVMRGGIFIAIKDYKLDPYKTTMTKKLNMEVG